MEPRSGIFQWEHEPADDRQSQFAPTQGWEGDTQSALWSPSRLDARRRARRDRRRALGVVVALAVATVALLGVIGVLLAPRLGSLLG